MKRNILPLIVPVFLLMGFSGGAFAELTPEQAKQAEALIKQFSARQFAVRQQAVEELIEMGPDVLPLVRKTLAETDDAEVKLRCQMVIKGIEKAYGVRVTGDDLTVVPGPFEPSRITIDVTQRPLSEVLQMFSDQSGNRIITLSKDLEDRTIDFQVKDMPYWQALDQLCEKEKLLCRHRFRPQRLELQRALKVDHRGVRVGPLVVRVLRVSRDRHFLVGDRSSVQEGLNCQIMYYWEDRLNVLSSVGRVTRVTTPDGKIDVGTRVPAYHVPDADKRQPFTSFCSYGTVLPCGGITLHLPKLPRRLREIDEIEGVIRLKVTFGERRTAVKDVVHGQTEIREFVFRIRDLPLP